MVQFTDPSTGNDTVTGTGLADTFIWRGGDDTYTGGSGGDTLVLGRDDVTQWWVGGTSVSAPVIGGQISINTSSVETFEFIEPTVDSGFGFAVELLAATAASVITRGTTGTAYTVLGSGAGDTLIARGLGSDVSLDRPTVDLVGWAGNDTFKVELDSGGVDIFAGSGTDRLVVNALRDDVEVLVNTPVSNTITLKWDDTVAQFRSDLEEIEFADITTDGSPLVLSYAELANPSTPITGTDIGEVITDGVGVNTIQALGGNDWINMVGGNDTVDGGAGTDMISFAEVRGTSINAILSQGIVQVDSTQTVSVSNIENVTGTSGRDLFMGDNGANWFRGLGGSDRFSASAGGDLINGGAGTDSYFANTGDNSDMSISLLRGRVWDGTGEGTRLSNVEYVYSGGGDDTLIGDHVSNLLYGGGGEDTIMGNGGDDIINGEEGMDVAIYGYARDQYTVTQGTNLYGSAVTFVEYTGTGAGDGLDTLASIEILRFADGDFLL